MRRPSRAPNPRHQCFNLWGGAVEYGYAAAPMYRVAVHISQSGRSSGFDRHRARFRVHSTAAKLAAESANISFNYFLIRFSVDYPTVVGESSIGLTSDGPATQDAQLRQAAFDH
jgi:hypothetical protein